MSHSIEKAAATRTQPVGLEVSAYTIKQMKQEAINAFYAQMEARGEVGMRVSTTEKDGVVEIKVSIHENLYV